MQVKAPQNNVQDTLHILSFVCLIVDSAIYQNSSMK